MNSLRYSQAIPWVRNRSAVKAFGTARLPGPGGARLNRWNLLLPALLIALIPWQAASQDRRGELDAHLRQAQIHLEQENYKGVVDELRKALAIHDQIPGAYYQLGLSYFQLGETQEAETAFLKELDFDPPDPFSLYYLGRIRLTNGEVEKAIGRFEEVLRVGNLLDVQRRLAGAYLSVDKVDQAAALLEPAVEAQPEQGDLHYLLGRAYRKKGRDAEARREFQLAELWKNKHQDEIRSIMEVRRLLREKKRIDALQVVEELRATADEHILLSLGMALGQHGLHQEALPILQSAVERNPEYAEAHYNFGRAHAMLSNPAEAIQHLRKAVELRPEFYEARSLLGTTLVKLGENEEAIRNLRAAAEIRPDNVRLLAMVALQYLQGRYYDEAIKALERAIELDSQNADLHFLLIQAHHLNHDFERALAMAERTRIQFPEVPRGYLQVGMQLDNMGRFQEARAQLEAALARDSKLFEARILLGQVLLKLGLPEESIAEFRAVLSQDPDLIHAYAGIGKALIQLKRYEETAAMMEKAVRSDSRLASIHLYLSQAYRALGKLAEAKEEAAIFTRLNRERAKARDKDVERSYAP
jgi:tetratricopeptide (TPR) repeat protein